MVKEVEVREFGTNAGKFIAVKVPHGSNSFELSTLEGNPIVRYAVTQFYGGDSNNFGSIHKHYEDQDLPAGEYILLGLAKRLSDFQWAQIVNCIQKERLYYVITNPTPDNGGDVPIATTDAQKAGLSLLYANNIEPYEEYLILKRLNTTYTL